MPRYTAQVGHWAENLADEVARRVGGMPDRQALTEILARVGREMDLLTGRTFAPVQRRTETFEPNGLPFVDVPDMHVGSMEPCAAATAVPDPVNPAIATVVQVAPSPEPAASSVPVAEALWIAGQIVAQAVAHGYLSADYVMAWLAAIPSEERVALLHRVTVPTVRLSVPVLGMSVAGWWVQVARRLMWVTGATEEEGRLVEPLLDPSVTDGQQFPLVAGEAILIVARLTQAPVAWAFTARLWPEGVQLRSDRPWAKIAKAVHGHGIPTITLDRASTPPELACQVVLKGYWHGYVGRDEPGLANAVAQAYPQQVERIRRITRAPDATAAGALLLERLLYPGFDPARGAEATRRYVRRMASIVVMEHRKADEPERYPWTQLGISERRYYKLLPRFASKVDGRYVVEQGDVVARIRAYLDRRDASRETRVAALAVLQGRGFSEAAARKWLQRHRAPDAVNAWPRSPKGSTT